MKPYHHLPGYLHRWQVLKVGKMMARIHHILTPDNTPYLHTHPFSYASLILDGGYTEQVLVDGVLAERTYRKYDIARHLNTTPHRITSVLPGTRTLFLTWSSVKSTEQGWTLLSHPNIDVPVGYVSLPDGVYRHGDGFRKRKDGVWFALRPTIDDAVSCDRLSLHQHLSQDDLHALDPTK